MQLQQMLGGIDNFCYVVFDEKEKTAAVVDPGFDISPILQFLDTHSLTLVYIIATHYHHDHTSKMALLKEHFPRAMVVASFEDGMRLSIPVDVFVGDAHRLLIGSVELLFLATPGHTKGSLCILVDQKYLLTGDTLFIGDCGRTDLPSGSNTQMFDSLQRIKMLTDDIIVYPGHDYGDTPFDTLGHQKKINTALRAKDLQEFSQIP